jgi:hypothetical protein
MEEFEASEFELSSAVFPDSLPPAQEKNRVVPHNKNEANSVRFIG